MNALRQVSSAYVLWPAYGRTYANANDMLQDWLDEKDFRIAPSGPYCSIRDIGMMRQECSSIWLQDPRTKHQVKVD